MDLSKMKKFSLGALIVAVVGLFLPFATAKVLFVSVSKNFIDGDGVIILVLSIIAAILIFKKKNTFPIVLNIVSLIITIVDIINVSDTISSSDYGSYIKVEYGIGCWIVLIGLIVSIVCLILDKKNNNDSNVVVNNNYQQVPGYSTMTSDVTYNSYQQTPSYNNMVDNNNYMTNQQQPVNNTSYQPRFYCSNCGVELSNEGSFCPNCGVKKS